MVMGRILFLGVAGGVACYLWKSGKGAQLVSRARGQAGVEDGQAGAAEQPASSRQRSAASDDQAAGGQSATARSLAGGSPAATSGQPAGAGRASAAQQPAAPSGGSARQEPLPHTPRNPDREKGGVEPEVRSDTSAVNDLELARLVKEELQKDPHFPREDVIVNADQGRVTLRGTVTHSEHIEEAEAGARRVKGVNDVENLLHVKGSPAPSH